LIKIILTMLILRRCLERSLSRVRVCSDCVDVFGFMMLDIAHRLDWVECRSCRCTHQTTG